MDYSQRAHGIMMRVASTSICWGSILPPIVCDGYRGFSFVWLGSGKYREILLQAAQTGLPEYRDTQPPIQYFLQHTGVSLLLHDNSSNMRHIRVADAHPLLLILFIGTPTRS